VPKYTMIGDQFSGSRATGGLAPDQVAFVSLAVALFARPGDVLFVVPSPPSVGTHFRYETRPCLSALSRGRQFLDLGCAESRAQPLRAEPRVSSSPSTWLPTLRQAHSRRGVRSTGATSIACAWSLTRRRAGSGCRFRRRLERSVSTSPVVLLLHRVVELMGTRNARRAAEALLIGSDDEGCIRVWKPQVWFRKRLQGPDFGDPVLDRLQPCRPRTATASSKIRCRFG
jgi:hypothetical protein